MDEFVQANKRNSVFYGRYQYHEEERGGMKYGVWSLSSNRLSSQSGYTIAVVNLTKEALEVELLKLQIANLKAF